MAINRVPVIETQRLVLRAFTAADAHAVQRLAGDPAVAATTLVIPHPYTDGLAERWIATHATQARKGGIFVFAICLRATAELIGSIGVHVNKRDNNASIGYWIGKPYWNLGYCTEAATAVVGFGFNTLGLNKMHAFIASINPASGRVLEKLGMVHEGHRPAHIRKADQYYDTDDYGLLRGDYLERLSK